MNVPDECLVLGASLFPDSGTPVPGGRGVQLQSCEQASSLSSSVLRTWPGEDCLRCRTL